MALYKVSFLESKKRGEIPGSGPTREDAVKMASKMFPGSREQRRSRAASLDCIDWTIVGDDEFRIGSRMVDSDEFFSG